MFVLFFFCFKVALEGSGVGFLVVLEWFQGVLARGSGVGPKWFWMVLNSPVFLGGPKT